MIFKFCGSAGMRAISGGRSSVSLISKILPIFFLTISLAHGVEVPTPPQSISDTNPQSAYKAGYEAGYKAALEALKSGNAAAPTSPTTASPPVAAPQSAKADGPPDWWNHSALIYPALTPTWRHHAELQISASSLSGNDEGSAVRGGGKLISRFNQWTNELIFSSDKRSINQSGVINKRDTRMFQESLRYDLTNKLYAAGGYIWETDDVNFIDNRHTVLGGLGYYIFDTPRMRLNAFAGLGKFKETYLEPVPDLIGKSGRSSGLIYLYETFDWQIAERWSLQQGFRQIRDLDESGVYVLDPSTGTYVAPTTVKRYRNAASLSLNYQMSPRSVLSLGVDQRHDSNPWPDVKPTDTTRRLSVNFIY